MWHRGFLIMMKLRSNLLSQNRLIFGMGHKDSAYSEKVSTISYFKFFLQSIN